MSIQRTNRNNRIRVKALEKKVADFLGFYRVPYSGTSTLFGWGDVRDMEDQGNSRYLGECKSITPRSKTEVNIIIKEEWLVGKNSITKKAKDAGNRIPFLTFSKVRSPRIFGILDIKHLKMFFQALDILTASGIVTDTLDEHEMATQIDTLHRRMVKNGEIQSYTSQFIDDEQCRDNTEPL